MYAFMYACVHVCMYSMQVLLENLKAHLRNNFAFSEHAQNVQNGRRTVDYMDSDGEIIQRVSEASEPAADLGRRRVYQTSRFDKNDVRFPYEK